VGASGGQRNREGPFPGGCPAEQRPQSVVCGWWRVGPWGDQGWGCRWGRGGGGERVQENYVLADGGEREDPTHPGGGGRGKGRRGEKLRTAEVPGRPFTTLKEGTRKSGGQETSRRTGLFRTRQEGAFRSRAGMEFLLDSEVKSPRKSAYTISRWKKKGSTTR